MTAQWSSADYLTRPSATALSTDIRPSGLEANGPNSHALSCQTHQGYINHSPARFITSPSSGYYRSPQGYTTDSYSDSMTSLPWPSLNQSLSMNHSHTGYPVPLQPPASRNPQRRKPTPLHLPNSASSAVTSNPPKTFSSTPNTNMSFCFMDQLPFSPISAGDLTTELAKFHDFLFSDTSALSNGSFLNGSSDYVMSDWNAKRKPANTDVEMVKMLSLLDDVHGSIAASDLDTSKPKPQHTMDSCSLHLNSNTSIWDSTASLVEKELNQLKQCSYCHRDFKSAMGLTKHLKVCTPEAVKQRYCAICDRMFRDARTYKLHKERQHRTINQCSQCQQIFTTALLLRQHAGTHRVGIKIKSCWRCGTQFPTRYRHRKHMAVCAQQSKFMCHNCGHDFPSVYCRSKHLETCVAK